MYIKFVKKNNNIGGFIMKKNIQKIKCNVYDCKFCDVDNITCNLKEIKVASCNHDNNKESTMCSRYKTRKD